MKFGVSEEITQIFREEDAWFASPQTNRKPAANQPQTIPQTMPQTMSRQKVPGAA